MTWSKTSAHARGYGGAWRKLRDIVMRRDCGLCHCPRCQGGKLRLRAAHEVDHIRPRAQGGTDDLDNLRAVNRECHIEITLQASGRQRRPHIGIDGYPIESMCPIGTPTGLIADADRGRGVESLRICRPETAAGPPLSQIRTFSQDRE